ALMDLMDPRNMSEDEIIGPTHPPVYQLRPAEWQSMELRQCFQTLDELYRSDWESGTRSGNPPRTLLVAPDGATARVRAPNGLPRNCYDLTWLRHLKKHEREGLMIQDRVIDLSIAANVDTQDVEEKMEEEEEEEEEEL
ncbi:hypothetical protein BDY19DRAFT_900596, partial [Irpex rosettiformis]